jgi:hypothetical protein
MPGMPDREGLIARVRQMRRAAASDSRSTSEAPGTDDPAIGKLEARIALLEGQLEGLQDSVHRESQRQSRRLAELEARMEPSALAIALSRDARERGL